MYRAYRPSVASIAPSGISTIPETKDQVFAGIASRFPRVVGDAHENVLSIPSCDVKARTYRLALFGGISMSDLTQADTR